MNLLFRYLVLLFYLYQLSGGIATVGITDHAANALGDVVFVELPAAGKVYKAGY